MYINTTFTTKNHSKSIVDALNHAANLPFHDILSSQQIANVFQTVDYRERVFTPDITIWAFLSQVLSQDKSCQATLARVIAFFVAQGKKAPSANTAAYSKARSRLSEEIIVKLTRDTAKQFNEQLPASWC